MKLLAYLKNNKVGKADIKSAIYNSQVLEATQVPISKEMDQKTMVHLHNGFLHRKKEGAPTLCHSMDGTGEHYPKLNMSGSERQGETI